MVMGPTPSHGPCGGPMAPPADDRLAEAARALLAARAADASICPSDVVRGLWRDAAPPAAPSDGWRAWMPAIRGVAVTLAVQGVLRITRGAETLPPDAARLGAGPIRLRRGPRFDAAAPTATDSAPAD